MGCICKKVILEFVRSPELSNRIEVVECQTQGLLRDLDEITLFVSEEQILGAFK